MKQLNNITNKYFAVIYFATWILCVLIAFASCNTKSQSKMIYITGKIIEKTSHKTITDADIYIVSTEKIGNDFIQYPIKQIKSDNLGYYSTDLEPIEGLDYCLDVHKRGYYHYSLPINNNETQINSFIELEPLK